MFSLKRVVRKEAKDQRFIEQAILEHSVAIRFNHPSLRKSFNVIKSRSFLRTSEVCVVMEYVEGTTLEDYQEKVTSILDLCIIFQQVAEALQVMHQGGYIHADIKPKNILILPGRHIKLIDFGQSCPTGTVKERIQGTPDFIAPEQVTLDRIMPQTDVFNLGASLYWCLTGKFVPTLMLQKRESNDIAVSGKQETANVRELNPKVPTSLANLVMACVEENPQRRPSNMNDVHGRLAICIAQLQREAKPSTGPVQPPVTPPLSVGMKKPIQPVPPPPPATKPFKPLPKPGSTITPSTTVGGLDLDALIEESLPEAEPPKARKLDPNKSPPPNRPIYDADKIKPEE